MSTNFYCRSLFKILLACLLQILLFSHNALGRDDLPEETATDPAYFVRDIIQGCKNIINLEDRENYIQLLGDFLNENMNYQAIGSFVMGRHWRDMTEEQRAQVGQALGPFIINKYLIYLDEFLRNQEKIEIIDSVYRSNMKDYLVRTAITMRDEKDLIVSWRVFLDPETKRYKVSDIIVHRLSLLLTIRMQLIDYVDHNGIEKTIQLMTSKQEPDKPQKTDKPSNTSSEN